MVKISQILGEFIFLHFFQQQYSATVAAKPRLDSIEVHNFLCLMIQLLSFDGTLVIAFSGH